MIYIIKFQIWITMTETTAQRKAREKKEAAAQRKAEAEALEVRKTDIRKFIKEAFEANQGPDKFRDNSKTYDVAFKNVKTVTQFNELLEIYKVHREAIQDGSISLLDHVTGTASDPADSDEESGEDTQNTVSTTVVPQQLINILSNIEKSKDSERRTHLRAIGYAESDLQAMTSDELADRLKAYELATGSSGEYSGTYKSGASGGMTMQDRLKLKSITHQPDWAYGESEVPTLPTTAELIKKYNKRLNIPPGYKIPTDGTETFGGDNTIFLNDLNAFERFALLHYDDRPEVKKDRDRLLAVRPRSVSQR